MYSKLKRTEKLLIAKNFYLYLNAEYSEGSTGLPMSNWVKILSDLNEEYNITSCVMWKTSYRSVFDILLKYYQVFEITEQSSYPYLYDIINNHMILQELNIH